jgi:hypothetical protein
MENTGWKDKSGLDHKLRTIWWLPPPVSIKAHISWALMSKHLIIYWRIRDLWGLANLVVSCVTELDNTLPRFTGVQLGSVWATHGMSAEAYVWKTTLGWGRTWHDSLTVSWTVATRGALLAHGCRVVRFIPLRGWLLIVISTTTLEMGDGLIVVFKRRITNFILLWWKLYGWGWLLCSHHLC